MSSAILINLFRVTLQTPIAADAVVAQLSAGSVAKLKLVAPTFENGDYIRLCITQAGDTINETSWDWIDVVGYGTGEYVYIARNVEGVALAWPANSKVEGRLSKGVLDAMRGDSISSELARIFKVGPQISGASVAVTLSHDEQLAQLPRGIGPQNSQGSLCVTAAYDSKFPISKVTSALQIVPPVATTAYVAGNVVGGTMTLAAAVGERATGLVQSVQVTSKSVQTDSLTLWLFSALPTASAFKDQTAPAIAPADVPKLYGRYLLGAPVSTLGVHTLWQLDNIGKSIALPQYGPIYAVLTRGGTKAFDSTTDLTVSICIQRD